MVMDLDGSAWPTDRARFEAAIGRRTAHPRDRPDRVGQDHHAVRRLTELNTPDRTIVTVEDPVEYELPA